MIQKIDGGVFYNYFIAFGDFVTFFGRDIGLNSITLENINLYNGHCDYCDLETINHVKIWIYIINISNVKHLKIDRRRFTSCCIAIQQNEGIGACKKIKRKKLAANFYNSITK